MSSIHISDLSDFDWNLSQVIDSEPEWNDHTADHCINIFMRITKFLSLIFSLLFFPEEIFCQEEMKYVKLCTFQVMKTAGIQIPSLKTENLYPGINILKYLGKHFHVINLFIVNPSHQVTMTRQQVKTISQCIPTIITSYIHISSKFMQ